MFCVCVCSSADAGTPALFPSGEAQESQEWHWQDEKTGQGEPTSEGCELLGSPAQAHQPGADGPARWPWSMMSGLP